MNEELLKIADGLQVVSESIRAMVKEQPETVGTQTEQAVEKQEEMEHTVTIEDVRAVLASKSQSGKTREVKGLLLKYDAGKLSGVKPEDYPALLKEAEAL